MNDENMGGQHAADQNAFRLQVQTLVAQGKLTPEEAADIPGEGGGTFDGPPAERPAVNRNKPAPTLTPPFFRSNTPSLPCPGGRGSCRAGTSMRVPTSRLSGSFALPGLVSQNCVVDGGRSNPAETLR